MDPEKTIKSDVALIRKSLDGRITSWNDGAEKMFGYTATEAIGKHISIVIPFDWQDEEYMLLDRLKAEDYLEVHQTVRRTKEGIFLKVRLSATPVRDEGGKIVGALKKVELVETLGRTPPPPPEI